MIRLTLGLTNLALSRTAHIHYVRAARLQAIGYCCEVYTCWKIGKYRWSLQPGSTLER